jgi:hypothetical protein
MTSKTWIGVALAAIGAVAACVGGAAPNKTDDVSPPPFPPRSSPSPPVASGEAGASAAALHECNPLALEAPPISLGTIAAAGRAADGTVYVLDRTNGAFGELRAFISDGAVLRRRKVAGSGGGPGSIDVSLGSPGAELQIKVVTANGTATRMGILRGPPDPATKSFEIGVQGEELALLSAADLVSFAVVNISSVRVMYDATTTEGHRFVAFTTDVDYSDDKVRLFYGTDDRLVQRRLISINVDSSTHVQLDIDGVETTAQLMFNISWDGWGPPRLQPTGGAAASALLLIPVPGSPGANWAWGRELPDGGLIDDAGPRPPPETIASDADLVAGLRFFCF